MKLKFGPDKAPAVRVLKDIRRETRRQYSKDSSALLPRYQGSGRSRGHSVTLQSPANGISEITHEIP